MSLFLPVWHPDEICPPVLEQFSFECGLKQSVLPLEHHCFQYNWPLSLWLPVEDLSPELALEPYPELELKLELEVQLEVELELELEFELSHLLEDIMQESKLWSEHTHDQ